MVKVYQTLIFCAIFTISFHHSFSQKIYFSDGGAVKRMNLNATGVETIIPGTTFQYIAVDALTAPGFLFYNNGQETRSALLDGTSPALITDDGAFAGYSNIATAPDYEALVYVGISDDMDDLWHGSYYDTPSTPPTMINNGINMGGDEEYLDVVYNIGDGKLYYTGADNAVYSSYPDGSDVALIVGSNAYGPIGVDYLNSKIYWVRYTAPNYFMMSANLDGTGAATIHSNGNNSIESLDVYPEQNAVFYAQTNAIFRMALNGTGATSIFTGTYITNIAIDFDVTPPAFSSLGPVDGATNVLTTANLTMAFNENLKRSTATGTADELSIRIYKTTGDVLVETIARSSANISISGSSITINPTITLDYNTDYYVLAGNKVFSDLTDNNWIGITLSTGWNFKTAPNPAASFYSRQNGNWNTPNTWSNVSHTGPAASTSPGTGTDVIIGNGHTVTLTGNTSAVANTAVGTWIMSGATLNAATYDLDVWGTLRIDGQLLNAGALAGTFNLYASGGIPVFDELQYGVAAIPGSPCNIYTHVVALNGIQSINGGTINTNGFQICVPPTPPPTSPVFSNNTNNSITLSWTSGGGNAFVVARQGSTSFKPTFGVAYTANPVFGSGSQIGTGNFLVYSGTGNTITITGLTAGTYYEFDLYSFTSSIGGCYSIQNYELASATSCVLLPAPANPVNAQYCTGDTKPAINVDSPGSGKNIRWYDAATGGTLVPGDDTGGDGRGGVFIPAAASGTFYAETYDGTSQCSSPTRTAVTLTLHPPLGPGTPSAAQAVCSGGDPAVINGGTATGGTGTYTYQWESATASGGPYTAIPTADQPTYDPPAGIVQTTYYHRLTRSSTCIQPGAPVAVTVTTTPVITSQPTSPQVCDGKSATFSVAATGTSLTYQWQSNNGSGFTNVGNGGVFSGALTNQLQISNVAGLNNVQYQCIIFSGGSCPVTSSAVPLIVNPNPVVVNQTQAICEGTPGTGVASVDLTALNSAITGGAGGMSVSWFTNATLTTPVANPSNASASNNTTFYARVSNGSTGCTNTATTTISVNSKPSGAGNIAGATTICTNTPSIYTISGISNALQYQWQLSPGLQIVSQSGTTASIQASSGSNGTISAIGENSCGTGGSANLTVQILTAPTFQIVAPQEILIGSIASFSYQSSSVLQNILWDFGDNATSTEEAPQHAYTSEGNYVVTLEASDNTNCENTDDVSVVVLPLPALTETNIKNVITANGDSHNGVLYIENIEKYPSNQVVLLDRWGVEVFKEDNYDNDWDARRNGEFLPAGQYVCVVKLNETGKIYSRTVSIIKRK